MEKQEPSHIAGGAVTVANSLAVPLNNTELTYDPAIPSLGRDPRELKMMSTHTKMFIVALCITIICHQLMNMFFICGIYIQWNIIQP